MVMDITALYPSVPHKQGLDSFGRALTMRREKSVHTKFLVRLMMVLKSNTFEWDKKLFLQILGTAIGTRSAPTFCGLYVGELEQEILNSWASLDPEALPADWWRFIEDCLFWLSGTLGDLVIFVHFVNQFNPYIKFTVDYNFTTRSVDLEFLDLKIWVDDDGIIKTI